MLIYYIKYIVFCQTKNKEYRKLLKILEVGYKMKVILLNGSPHKKGTTFRSLEEVAKTLKESGVESEIVWIGNSPIRGCIGCYSCRKTGKCAFSDAEFENIAQKIKDADGLVIGSPVYYASISGTLKCLLDRLFFCYGGSFKGKIGAAVAVARRAGTTATLDIINKYFMISEMPVVSSTYWNMAHGTNYEEAECDMEGMQTMRNLGKNMAWLIKSRKVAAENGDRVPETERGNRTNFVR